MEFEVRLLTGKDENGTVQAYHEWYSLSGPTPTVDKIVENCRGRLVIGENKQWDQDPEIAQQMQNQYEPFKTGQECSALRIDEDGEKDDGPNQEHGLIRLGRIGWMGELN